MMYYTDYDARFVMNRLLTELPGATGRVFQCGLNRSGFAFKIKGNGYQITGRGPGDYTANGVKFTTATDVIKFCR